MSWLRVRRGRRLGATAGCLLLAACGTGAPGPASAPAVSTLVPAPMPAAPASLPVPSPAPIDLSKVPGRVHLDPSGGAAAWFGPAGGTLATTGADGTGYRLVIPPLALRDPTPIQMTPIASIDRLGLSVGLAGSVYLGPVGLQLDEPATLTITAVKAPSSGGRLVGFDVGDDGQTALVPAIGGSGDEVSVLVFHFSSPGAGYGTSEDLQRFGPSPANPLSADVRITHGIGALLAEDTPWAPGTMIDAYAFIQLLWGTTLQDELTTAQGDQNLLAALADWRQFVFLLNLYAHRGDVAAALADGLDAPGPFPPLTDPSLFFHAGQALVGHRIADAIQGNTALCIGSHDLDALANIWFWAAIGDRYAPMAGSTWLGSAKACADLDIPVANLPSTMGAGQTGTVTLQFAMAFGDGTKTNVDVQVDLQGSGVSLGSTGGATATAGVAGGTTLNEAVAAQAAPPFSLLVHACWSLGGLVRALCHDFHETFGAGAPPPPTASVPTPSPRSIDLSAIGGSYQIRLICQNESYGTGQGQVVVSGATITMTWTVTVTAPADASGDCSSMASSGKFPSSGSFSGTGALGPGGAVDVAVTAWQVSPCIDAAAASPTVVSFRGPGQVGVPISTCTLSSLFGQMGYQGTRTGP
jgi:hypothetical protein